MPNPKGAMLTDRDRALLSYVGIARYASAEQLHRLFFDGRSKKQTYRRLAKLCEPGNRPGEGACLRRLEYRRKEGTGVPVWALTPYGRSLVVPLVPWLRPPAQHDTGARFLEHTLLLNEVLAGLVQRLRVDAAAPLAALPFRWVCEDDSVLRYEIFERATHSQHQSLLKPDAIVEIPARKRRLFVEAETGTQSIATANPGRNGAIVSKLSRYADFFHGLVALEKGETWYRRAFPDAFEPRVVFLVHSEERLARVNAAVKACLGSGGSNRFQVLVFTFANAADVLAPYIASGTYRPPAPRSMRVVTMDVQKAEQLRDGYNQLAEALNATREAVKRHNATPGAVQVSLPPARLDAAEVLREFIRQELSAPSASTSSEGQRTGATHG
jgi:protein involved in plasmid replication-relaxation